MGYCECISVFSLVVCQRWSEWRWLHYRHELKKQNGQPAVVFLKKWQVVKQFINIIWSFLCFFYVFWTAEQVRFSSLVGNWDVNGARSSMRVRKRYWTRWRARTVILFGNSLPKEVGKSDTGVHIMSWTQNGTHCFCFFSGFRTLNFDFDYKLQHFYSCLWAKSDLSFPLKYESAVQLERWFRTLFIHGCMYTVLFMV